MTWTRGELIWHPDGTRPWARHSALQPTPLVLQDRIRVYCGVRDDDGRASVAWVDLDLDDPTRVLGSCPAPALAPRIGTDAWDRDGVVPTAIVSREDGIHLFYAGYERVEDPLVRFRAFSGLATSADGGATFERRGDGQLLHATPDEPLFRVIHSILPDGRGGWRAWYGAGGAFVQGATKTLPVYDIRTMASSDGVTFPQHGTVVLGQRGDEHRVGRPYVVDRGEGHLEMYFGGGSDERPYRLAFARSTDDGATWHRDDEELGELARPGTWDQRMSAYPAVVSTPRGRVMFYNGDDYGRAGFGIAHERT